jgi:hypothetical protein
MGWPALQLPHGGVADTKMPVACNRGYGDARPWRWLAWYRVVPSRLCDNVASRRLLLGHGGAKRGSQLDPPVPWFSLLVADP